MKILFADAIPESFIEILRGRGDECVVSPGISAEDLPEAIGAVSYTHLTLPTIYSV